MHSLIRKIQKVKKADKKKIVSAPVVITKDKS